MSTDAEAGNSPMNSPPLVVQNYFYKGACRNILPLEAAIPLPGEYHLPSGHRPEPSEVRGPHPHGPCPNSLSFSNHSQVLELSERDKTFQKGLDEVVGSLEAVHLFRDGCPAPSEVRGPHQNGPHKFSSSFSNHSQHLEVIERGKILEKDLSEGQNQGVGAAYLITPADILDLNRVTTRGTQSSNIVSNIFGNRGARTHMQRVSS